MPSGRGGTRAPVPVTAPAMSRPHDRVLLRFDPGQHHIGDTTVRRDLSCVSRVGPHLWLGSDEGRGLDRLTAVGEDEFAKHAYFPLDGLLDLPGDEEIDIEGLAHDGHYLWIVGSHSLKREKPGEDGDAAERMARLAEIERDDARWLLARVPVVPDPDTGDWAPHACVPHPERGDMLTARQLRGGKRGNQLVRALASDEHLAPFLDIPSKENGFDVEGLAAADGRLYVGLRGPVLRGWAVVLSVEPRETVKPGRLKLRKLDDVGRRYRKHFLDLAGMGIRELSVHGDDLLILAGPTMALDGTIALWRWPGGARATGDGMVDQSQLERLFDIPHGHGPTAGRDRAEGLTMLDDDERGRARALVVYDAPTDDRLQGAAGVWADVYRLD